MSLDVQPASNSASGSAPGGSGSATGGVRRCHATILFADVCSSTQLAEICDPESLAEILHRVRQTAERVVAEHHGVINQFYGDGILAAFGFPTPHEHDVLRATEAALALNAAIAALPLKPFLPRGFNLQLHSGVHAGLIVVQDGDRLQGQYKLYGDALNTAARLADAADEGEVFASETTLRGVLPYFEVERLPPLQLKGKGASLPAYRVLRRTAIQTRFEASISRGLTPFIGRQFEQGELLQRLHQCGEGRLQTVRVTGDAGLGKTRLVEEFLDALEDDTGVIRVRCDRDGRAVPLQPFMALIRQRLGLAGDPMESPGADQVEQSLQAMPESVRRYAALFRSLLSSQQDQDGQRNAETIAEASAALFQHWPDGQRSLVLFIDDWHWVDELSRQVLNEWVRLMEDLPVLVILASRQEKLSDQTLGVTSFSLDPFTLQESCAAVQSVLSHLIPKNVVETIHSRSGGNALFVEELCQIVRAEMEMGASFIDQIPATLHGLIESRLQRLQPEVEALVRSAAVIGDQVPCWLIETLVGYQLPKDLILELSHRDLLYLSDDRKYLKFKHGLTRDVIYESVPLRDRQALHMKVAAILQQRADRAGDDEFYEALAYHYGGGGDDQNALRYAELAGDKALAALALDRARIHYQSALESMDRLDNLPAEFEHWNRLAQRFGWTCIFDPLPEQVALLERTVELAGQVGDRRNQAKSEFWLGYVYYSMGCPEPAIAHLTSTLEGARATGEKGLEIHALSTLAQSLASACQYQQALDCFDEVAGLRGLRNEREKPSVGSAYAIACRAFLFADRGDFAEAKAQLSLAQQSIDGQGAEVEGSIWAVVAASSIWQGDWQAALDAANHATECARKINNTFVLGISMALAAVMHWRIDGELSHLDDAIVATNWLEVQGKHLFISIPYGLLAEALLEKGDYDGVRHFAARALQRARKGDRMGEAMAYRALAVLSRRCPEKTSRDFNHYIDRALQSAQLRDSRRERAMAALTRAESLAATDPERAREVIDTLKTQFESMQMHWYSVFSRGL